MKDVSHGMKAIYYDAAGKRICAAQLNISSPNEQTNSLDHVMIIVPEPDHRPRQVVLIAERAQARRAQ
jgi:hypothetical protein